MESISEQLAQLASADQAAAHRAYTAIFEATCRAGAPDNASQRAVLAAALAGELNARDDDRPRYSPRVRGQIARLLSLVAGAAEVPALSEAAADFHVREMARWSLARVAAPAATSALATAATEAVGPEYRVGAINSLAARPEPEAVAALLQLANDADREVRLAALEALAVAAVPAAEPQLAAAARDLAGNPRALDRIHKARVRLGWNLAAAGQQAAAQQVFRAVLASDAAEPQLASARRGLENLA